MRFEKAMDDMILIRVAQDEKRRLVELARSRGMTLSALLRQTATEAERRVAA